MPRYPSPAQNPIGWVLTAYYDLFRLAAAWAVVWVAVVMIYSLFAFSVVLGVLLVGVMGLASWPFLHHRAAQKRAEKEEAVRRSQARRAEAKAFYDNWRKEMVYHSDPRNPPPPVTR